MGIAMITIAISSCTEDTTMVGNSLVSSSDQFTIVSDTFNVSTRSFIADSILARSSYSYLGKIKDPETGSYITADYMTQFSLLEEEAEAVFPPLSLLRGEQDDHTDLTLADSCFLNIIVNDFMGDSLAAMKMTACELDKPVQENRQYYTNYDLEENGFLRTNGIRKNTLYTLSDLTQSDSMRYLNQTGSNFFRIRVSLNEPYTDKNGVTYNNYGSYLIRAYYDHPEYFKNSQTFIQKVCPGFYFKTTDGLGLMTEVYQTQLTVNIHYMLDGNIVSGSKSFYGNEEVLQTTHFISDKNTIKRLAEDTKCTYLKAPDGVFTEVTLPVDDIKRGHENDTITSAKVTFTRMRPRSDLSEVILEEPTQVLLIEKDSLKSFFEDNGTPDNMKAYLATYNSNQKTYSFNNLSYMINRMYARKGQSENWNKAVLIPVEVQSNSSSTASGIANEMNVNSIRLVGGAANRHAPIRMSVIYNVNK